MIEIDGSFLEGGGQILRNALSFSCILRRSICIKNIRANRSNPGLSHQHLHGLNLLSEITGAKVLGNHLQSTQVTFEPGIIKSGHYQLNTQTAASISLVLQAVLPVLAYAEANSKLELVGGTNVNMSPQVDYMTEVLRPLQEKFGFSYDFDLLQRGYYPRGGGRCLVTIQAVPNLTAAQLCDFGRVSDISGWCYVAGRLPLHLAQQMKQTVEQELSTLSTPLDIMAYKESADMAHENGSGLVLCGKTSTGCVLGTDELGDKRRQPSDMGINAARELRDYLQAGICVDRHAQDQLIMLMALAVGESRLKTCKLTDHTHTAIRIAQLMTGVQFKTESKSLNETIISCVGLGLQNEQFK